MSDVKIHPSWKDKLEGQFELPYWNEMTTFVRDQYQTKKIYPPARQIFNAFEMCPFEEVKVVIIGQDPYHGSGQANGLSFAVSESVNPPPSLQNIFKEIKADLKIDPLSSGDLTRWAKQGVLLLNSVLTVEARRPASHRSKGWEEFTDATIEALNSHRQGIVYLLWGRYAQNKGEQIDGDKNLVLSSGHPSPYSAHLFHGHGHFSSANNYLLLQGLEEIDWR